ncbi:MAG TPA: AAA family ATPase [Longimicrobiales bacterium]|nr:AAA family ATPase [Longimicrobiales bacterium]
MPGAIASVGNSLALDCDRVDVDVVEFDSLLRGGQRQGALTLYRGDFLASFSLNGSPEFDHWADGQRALLARQAAAAFEIEVEMLTRAAEWLSARTLAERWLAVAPLSQGAAASLIRLHLKLGDRGAALTAYEAFRAAFVRELGISPAGDLEGLLDRAPTSRHAEHTADRPAESLVRPFREPGFVGRAREFKALSARWDRVRAGRHQLVLVEGEPGIGKTRLAREFADWARLLGATVLMGRAYEVEARSIPYAALARAFRSALDAPGLAAVDARSLADLRLIVPEIGDRFGGVPPAPEPHSDLGRLRLLDAAATLIDNLAYEAPVVFVLDDLPWVDDSTAAIVHHVWRALPDAPVFLLATARSGEASTQDAAARLMSAALREGEADVELLRLTPLSLQEVGEVVWSVSTRAPPSAADVAVLAEASGGNPLFLVESIRAWAAGSPVQPTMTVRAVVQQRVRRLPRSARRLLDAAAVLGRRFPLPTATAVARISRSEAGDAIAHLVDSGIIRDSGYAYDFTHDLLRQAAYSMIGEAARARLHQRTFEHLAATEDEGVGLDLAAALAMHATEGGLRQESRRWLFRAADLAATTYAHVEADNFLSMALMASETPAELTEAWCQIGELRRICARFGDAGRAYLRGLEHAEPGSRDHLAIRIRILDTAIRSGLYDPAEIEGAATGLLSQAQGVGGQALHDVYRALAEATIQKEDLESATAYAAAAVEAARDGEQRPLVRALLLHARLGVMSGALGQGLDVLGEAAGIANAADLEVEQSQVDIELATELMRLGKWSGAAEHLTSALRRAEASGDVPSMATATLNLADLRLRLGEWDAAETLLDRLDEASVGERFPHLQLYARMNRSLMRWLQGRYAEAAEIAAEVEGRASTLSFAPLRDLALALRALSLLDAHEGDAAPTTLDTLPVTDTSRYRYWPLDWEIAVLAKARAAASAGDAEEARRVLEAGAASLRDTFGRSLLEVELAQNLADDDPRRAFELLDETESRLGTAGPSPLLERVGRAREGIFRASRPRGANSPFSAP